MENCLVCVINKEGKPLMPTQRYGKVRRMLKDGRAKVVRKTPFTIQLQYETGDVVQDAALGLETRRSVGDHGEAGAVRVRDGASERRSQAARRPQADSAYEKVQKDEIPSGEVR